MLISRALGFDNNKIINSANSNRLNEKSSKSKKLFDARIYFNFFKANIY